LIALRHKIERLIQYRYIRHSINRLIQYR